jgi:hypothetical protein
MRYPHPLVGMSHSRVFAPSLRSPQCEFRATNGIVARDYFVNTLYICINLNKSYHPISNHSCLAQRKRAGLITRSKLHNVFDVRILILTIYRDLGSKPRAAMSGSFFCPVFAYAFHSSGGLGVGSMSIFVIR